MDNEATELIRLQRDGAQLAAFANRLWGWLAAGQSDFTESRARALLRAAGSIDDPTLADFARLMADNTAARVSLYDLLNDTGLGDNAEVKALAIASAQSPIPNLQSPIPWLPLAVAAYAWKNDYPLRQLDPAAPPSAHSPAGQVIQRAAVFLRRQAQRSATERDKIGRRLAQPPRSTPTLEELAPQPPVAPLPPVYRMPVPVRYPELVRETVQIDPGALPAEPPTPTRGEPIAITLGDLPAENRPIPPAAQPPIAITREQAAPQRAAPPSPLPGSGVVMPGETRRRGRSRPGLTVASVRQRLQPEPTTTTKLRVAVRQSPDGPGYAGLQVRVTGQGRSSTLAGVTDRDGNFLCEVAVPERGGLTVDVAVTWPREEGGDTERKSLTVNADRTEFSLPFYRRMAADH